MSIFTPNALDLLCERYFYPGHGSNCERCGGKHESEDQFIDRISLGKDRYAQRIRRKELFANSPTLFNVGTGQPGTLSACFKHDVQDDLESILDVHRLAALELKWGGGVGYVLSNVRPEGSPIKSTHRKACGPIGVMRMYHTLADVITQGGKRRGAQMAILHCDHPDVEKFIHCKDERPQDLDTFNISVACTDDFMWRASKGEHMLLHDMARSAWRTGDPGCYFIDAAERNNPTPWLGQLSGTNPCAEVPLLHNEACNLGSLNIWKFVRDGKIMFAELREAIRDGVDYLNEVLELNTFPDPRVTEAVRKTKKIGLGVMGWADALALLRVPYDSQEAVDLSLEMAAFLKKNSRERSSELGERHGPYPGWAEGADWRWRKKISSTHDLYGRRRNATVTCIAPTGTIAILADGSGGIEPHFMLEWDRKTGTGKTYRERISVSDQLGDFVPKTSMEIGWKWHVAHQAAWQKHVDLAVSKTINMHEDATEEEVLDAYAEAWRQGCTGVTIYRNKSRDQQVLNEVESYEGCIIDPETGASSCS